jgi:signal recognition particle receptor subunit beta
VNFNWQAEWSLGLLLTEDELQDIPILVLATKQDLPKVMTTGEISQGLSLEKSLLGRDWTILPVDSLTGKGVTEALDWIVAAIKRDRDKKKSKKLSTSHKTTEEKSILEEWLEIEDEPDDEFLEKLTKLSHFVIK